MNKAYKTVTERLTSVDLDFFEGSVKDTIKGLEKLHKAYPGYDDFILRGDWHPDAYTTYELFGERKETNKERDKRLAKAKKASASQKKRREKEAKAKEERERKTYEKLKAKFGKE